MEPKQSMKRSISHLIHDINRIEAIVHDVEDELVTTRPSSITTRKVSQMREQLSEIHARLDGVREFVLNCQKEALQEPPVQEVDVWL